MLLQGLVFLIKMTDRSTDITICQVFIERTSTHTHTHPHTLTSLKYIFMDIKREETEN